MMPTYNTETSKAIKEFSRFAHTYDSYNTIQAEVAKELVEGLDIQEIPTIIDIGCGSGTIYKNILDKKISFERFVALDSSEEMLALHPTHSAIEKIHADFNKDDIYEKLIAPETEALLLSSSSLQWSKDLDFSFSMLSSKFPNAHFAIFTANTFKVLHETAKINSPIYTVSELTQSIQKYYSASFRVKEYRLEFGNRREIFRYIKKSGVSGGERLLFYKQTKQLMQEYPLNYLEFEVLFIEATSLSR